VANEYQQFYQYWSDSSTSSKRFLNKFPYKLSLGVNSRGTPLLPFLSYSTSGNQIVVTEAYDKMFHRLMALREEDKGDRKGAVLTGQPGTGASLRLDPHAVRQLTDASRKNHLPKVHARAADFRSPGRTPVYHL